MTVKEFVDWLQKNSEPDDVIEYIDWGGARMKPEDLELFKSGRMDDGTFRVTVR